jgi:CxxC motif-containing protein
MIKKMVCIECPNGCVLEADMSLKPIGITGNLCPKGIKYAISEIENPQRVLTSSVLTEGLALKIVPVRTDRPIPKKDLFRAMEEIKKIRLIKPVAVGDIIIEDLLGLAVKLVATRECL